MDIKQIPYLQTYLTFFLQENVCGSTNTRIAVMRVIKILMETIAMIATLFVILSLYEAFKYRAKNLSNWHREMSANSENLWYMFTITAL